MIKLHWFCSRVIYWTYMCHHPIRLWVVVELLMLEETDRWCLEHCLMNEGDRRHKHDRFTRHVHRYAWGAPCVSKTVEIIDQKRVLIFLRLSTTGWSFKGNIAYPVKSSTNIWNCCSIGECRGLYHCKSPTQNWAGTSTVLLLHIPEGVNYVNLFSYIQELSMSWWQRTLLLFDFGCGCRCCLMTTLT
jgi:hypothetical protein